MFEATVMLALATHLRNTEHSHPDRCQPSSTTMVFLHAATRKAAAVGDRGGCVSQLLAFRCLPPRRDTRTLATGAGVYVSNMSRSSGFVGANVRVESSSTCAPARDAAFQVVLPIGAALLFRHPAAGREKAFFGCIAGPFRHAWNPASSLMYIPEFGDFQSAGSLSEPAGQGHRPRRVRERGRSPAPTERAASEEETRVLA